MTMNLIYFDKPLLIRDTVTRFLVSLTTRDCGGWEAAGSGSYCSAWVAAGYYLEIADLNSKFEHLIINHIEFLFSLCT